MQKVVSFQRLLELPIAQNGAVTAGNNNAIVYSTTSKRILAVRNDKLEEINPDISSFASTDATIYAPASYGYTNGDFFPYTNLFLDQAGNRVTCYSNVIVNKQVTGTTVAKIGEAKIKRFDLQRSLRDILFGVYAMKKVTTLFTVAGVITGQGTITAKADVGINDRKKGVSYVVGTASTTAVAAFRTSVACWANKEPVIIRFALPGIASTNYRVFAGLKRGETAFTNAAISNAEYANCLGIAVEGTSAGGLNPGTIHIVNRLNGANFHVDTGIPYPADTTVSANNVDRTVEVIIEPLKDFRIRVSVAVEAIQEVGSARVSPYKTEYFEQIYPVSQVPETASDWIAGAKHSTVATSAAKTIYFESLEVYTRTEVLEDYPYI